MPKHFALFSILPILLTANAHAQTQTTSPEPTIWDHNGSEMYLVANGSSREFYYRKPRPGMLEAGARSGSLLFRGQVKDGEYVGTAYLFNPRCGQIPFQVKGPILDNDERVVLTGQTPYVGRNCQTYGSFTSNLEFRLLKPIEASQSQGPLATAQSPGAEEPQPDRGMLVRLNSLALLQCRHPGQVKLPKTRRGALLSPNRLSPRRRSHQ